MLCVQYFCSRFFSIVMLFGSRKKPHPGPHRLAWGPAGYSEFSVGDLRPGGELSGAMTEKVIEMRWLKGEGYTSLYQPWWFGLFLNDTTMMNSEYLMKPVWWNVIRMVFSWVFTTFCQYLPDFCENIVLKSSLDGMTKRCIRVVMWVNPSGTPTYLALCPCTLFDSHP